MRGGTADSDLSSGGVGEELDIFDALALMPISA